MNQVIERNSIFELVRIIAMSFIVIYHLFLFFVARHYPDESLFKGIQIPLHIGVILFVLISGYFGIKCNLRGLFKLIMMVAVYYLPIALFTDLNGGGNFNQIIKDCLFISHSPYWFIRTYICLYLFSPVLNKYLNDINAKERIYLLATLGYISIYLGTSLGDPSLSDGKNLANFSFLYVLGNTLHYYEDKWRKISHRLLLIIYFFMNIILVCAYSLFAGSLFGKVIWRISFPYCSPILVLNAVLFFMILSRWQLNSKIINYIASSMFAVYLIHCQPFIEKRVIGCIMTKIFSLTGENVLYIIISTLLIGISIMAICVIIDKLLSPIWRIINIK